MNEIGTEEKEQRGDRMRERCDAMRTYERIKIRAVLLLCSVFEKWGCLVGPLVIGQLGTHKFDFSCF